MQGKQTKRNASEPWSETRSEVRRGVTVVGNLVEQEFERFLTGIIARESMAGRRSLCQTGYGGNLAFPG